MKRVKSSPVKFKAAVLLFARFAWVITHLQPTARKVLQPTPPPPHPLRKHRLGVRAGAAGGRQLLLSSRDQFSSPLEMKHKQINSARNFNGVKSHWLRVKFRDGAPCALPRVVIA